MNDQYKVPKNKLKVEITYADGKEEWAYLYLVEGERLQDVANDKRPFLPVLLLKNVARNQVREAQDNYDLVLINKQSIIRLKEL